MKQPKRKKKRTEFVTSRISWAVRRQTTTENDGAHDEDVRMKNEFSSQQSLTFSVELDRIELNVRHRRFGHDREIHTEYNIQLFGGAIFLVFFEKRKNSSCWF